MNYLLDTHTFLWFITDASEISATARELITDPMNRLYLSSASLWEMAIKVSIGRLQMPTPFAAFLEHQLELNLIER